MTRKGYYVQVYTNKFNNLHETDEFIEKYYWRRMEQNLSNATFLKVIKLVVD